MMSDKALVKQLQRELAMLEREMKSIGSGSSGGDSATLLREKEIQIEQVMMNFPQQIQVKTMLIKYCQLLTFSYGS